MLSSKLSHVFSSTARFQILGVLCVFSEPVPLRHLETLTGLGIRSVQVAVSGLEREGILRKKRKGKYTLFSLNNRNRLIPVIRKIFTLISEEGIQERSKEYEQGAREALQFSEEAIDLIRGAKKV